MINICRLFSFFFSESSSPPFFSVLPISSSLFSATSFLYAPTPAWAAHQCFGPAFPRADHACVQNLWAELYLVSARGRMRQGDNTRGYRRAGPECGHPIAKSALNNKLKYWSLLVVGWHGCISLIFFQAFVIWITHLLPLSSYAYQLYPWREPWLSPRLDCKHVWLCSSPLHGVYGDW